MSDRAYESAVAAYERLDDGERDRIDPQNRSLLFAHGRRTERVTVLLHGITASPRQCAALGAHAHRRGDNVLIPRLPGHGHTDRLSDALRDLRGGDLVRGLDETLAVAHGLGREVRVVGFSLGGLLAAWAAQHATIAEAIAIAPLLGLRGVPGTATAPLAALTLALPNAFLWWDPVKRERLMPAHGYPRYSTHAIAEALGLSVALLQRARTTPPRCPVTLVRNGGESAVSNVAIGRLAARWRARGGRVREHLLDRMPLSHDVVEPLRDRRLVAKSYPAFLALLDATPVVRHGA